MIDYIQSLMLGDEIVSISAYAIYWGKYSEDSYLQTAYHKQLAKSPFYKQVTIRNSKTFSAISNYLNTKKNTKTSLICNALTSFSFIYNN